MLILVLDGKDTIFLQNKKFFISFATALSGGVPSFHSDAWLRKPLHRDGEGKAVSRSGRFRFGQEFGFGNACGRIWLLATTGKKAKMHDTGDQKGSRMRGFLSDWQSAARGSFC